MATSLFLQEQFETTVQKAKDLRRVVDRLITLAKIDSLANRRIAYSYLLDKTAVQKLFSDIGPRFKARPGGYTRILRTRYRHGDAALLANISLVDRADPSAKAAQEKPAKKEPSAKKAAAPKKEAAPKQETAEKKPAKKAAKKSASKE